jgi:integrase
MAVRKDPKTGKWIYEYYDTGGKQHRLKGFETKNAANAKRREIEGEIDQGIHTPASTSRTVADACTVWIRRAEEMELDTKTIAQYRNHTDLHIIPLTDSSKPPVVPAWEGPLGMVKLSALNPSIAKAVQREFVRRLSKALARKVMVSFKSVLNEAVNNRMAAYNPALTVKNERRKRGEQRVNIGVDFPLKEEVGSIVAIMTGRWRPLIITFAFTGLRASELRGLEWSDVMNLDSDYPQLRVRQRADMDGLIGPVKTDSAQRTIPLSPLVADELRAWKKICPRDAETGEPRYVFPNGAGRIESHANISNRGWSHWQIQAGVCDPRRDDKGKIVLDDDRKPIMKARYGVHALRHFFASLMIDRGLNVKRVQALLGHAAIQITLDLYSHLFPPDRDDDRAAFASAEASVLVAVR